jgi:type 1 fimbria pilin
MASSRKHFQSVLSTAVLMACAAQLSLSHAADTGSVVVGGQVSASTCNIVISDVGATGVPGPKFLNLGTVTPGAVQSVADATSATAVGAVFSVKSTSSNSTPCNLGSTGKWDLALNLTQTQISYITGTKGVLVNGVTSGNGGTNAVVLLKGGVGTLLSDASKALPLDGDLGYSGPLMSGAANAGSITATSDKSIVLSAQFVRSAAADPTPGIYSQTIPLLAVYK